MSIPRPPFVGWLARNEARHAGPCAMLPLYYVQQDVSLLGKTSRRRRGDTVALSERGPTLTPHIFVAWHATKSIDHFKEAPKFCPMKKPA